MGKNFTQAAVVLFLLLLAVVGAGQDLEKKAEKEQEGMTFSLNTRAVEGAGREVSAEGGNEEWKDTVLFCSGYSGVDVWVDFL